MILKKLEYMSNQWARLFGIVVSVSKVGSISDISNTARVGCGRLCTFKYLVLLGVYYGLVADTSQVFLSF